MKTIYRNKGATRNQRLSQQLSGILSEAARRSGVGRVEVFSGGQDPKGVPNARRVGDATRHDLGNAADVDLYDTNGNKLNYNTDYGRRVVSEFITQAVSLGVTGVGAGPGYMGGQTRIHVGFGTPVTTWGAGNAHANAPDWLNAAFEAGVRDFQIANGLTPDGVVGPQTLAAIKKQQAQPTFTDYAAAVPLPNARPEPEIAFAEPGAAFEGHPLLGGYDPATGAPLPGMAAEMAVAQADGIAPAASVAPRDIDAEMAAQTERVMEAARQAATAPGVSPEQSAAIMDQAGQIASGIPVAPRTYTPPPQGITGISAASLPGGDSALQRAPISLAPPPTSIQRASAVPGSVPSFGATGSLGLTAEGRIANSVGLEQPNLTLTPQSIGAAEAMPSQQTTATARAPISTPQTIDPAQAMPSSQTQANQVGFLSAPATLGPPPSSAPRDVDAEFEAARQEAMDWAIRTATAPGVPPEVAQQAAAAAERLASTAPAPKPPAAPAAPVSLDNLSPSAQALSGPMAQASASKPIELKAPLSIGQASALPSAQTQVTASRPVAAPASYPPQARPNPASLGFSQPPQASIGTMGFAASPEVAANKPNSTLPVARPNPVAIGALTAPPSPQARPEPAVAMGVSTPQARPPTPMGPSIGSLGFAGSPEMPGNMPPAASIPKPAPAAPQVSTANSYADTDKWLDSVFSPQTTGTVPAPAKPMQIAPVAASAPKAPSVPNGLSSLGAPPTTASAAPASGVPDAPSLSGPAASFSPSGAPVQHRGLGAPLGMQDLKNFGRGFLMSGGVPFGGIMGALTPRVVGSLRNATGGMNPMVHDVKRIGAGLYSGAAPYGGGNVVSLANIGSRLSSGEHAAMLDAGIRARNGSGVSSGNSSVDRARRDLAGVGGLY